MKNIFQKFTLTFSIIFFLLLCATYLLLYNKINTNVQTAATDRTAWHTEDTRRQQISSLDASVKDIAPDQAALETHFIQSSDVVPLLDTIEKSGSEVGATASVSSVTTASDDSGLFVGVQANGSFDSIYKFITLLENSPYEIKFTSVDIESQPVASPAGKTAQSAKAPNWNALITIELLSFSK